VTVDAKGLGVAGGASLGICLTVRCHDCLVPRICQLAVSSQKIGGFVAFGQSALMAFITRLAGMALIAKLVERHRPEVFLLAELCQSRPMLAQPCSVVAGEAMAIGTIVGRVAGIASAQFVGGVTEMELKPVGSQVRRGAALPMTGLTKEGFMATLATLRVFADFKFVGDEPVVFKVRRRFFGLNGRDGRHP